MLNQKQSGSPYRADIDGLRAIAVVAVILNHWNSQYLPGGFIGVDVFFVISGYLITGIIRREEGKFSLTTFYRRRIQRIVPALFVMLVLVTMSCSLILLGKALERFHKSLNWSVLSFANLYFFYWFPTGYFEAPTQLEPLLHLWSLGVEEQFYFVWPLLLTLLPAKLSRKQEIFLIALTLFSFLGGTAAVLNGWDRFAYFMLPSRMGELTCGGLLVLFKGRIYSKLEGKFILANLLGLLGMGLLVISVYSFNRSSHFPGVTALVPCIGTSLLIGVGATNDVFVSKILAFGPVVSIGLISYSAYLYHWPMMALMRYQGHVLDFHVVVYSFVVGWISYAFVEQPTRRMSSVSDRSIFILFALSVAVILAFANIQLRNVDQTSSGNLPVVAKKCCLLINSQECGTSADCSGDLGDLCAFDGETGIKCNVSEKKILDGQVINRLKVRGVIYPEYRTYGLNYWDSPGWQDESQYFKNGILPLTKSSLIGDKAKDPIAFFFGDSNCQHFLPMFDTFARKLNMSIATQSIGGGAPDRRDEWYNVMLHWSKKFDNVVMALAWAMYGCDVTVKWAESIMIPQLRVNQTLLLIGQIPVQAGFNYDCHAKSGGLRKPECFPFHPQSYFLRCNSQLKGLAAKFPNVNYWDTDNILCPFGMCSPWIAFRPHLPLTSNVHPFYSDAYHYNFWGAQYGAELVLENWGLPAVLRMKGSQVRLPITGKSRRATQIKVEGYTFA